VSKAFGWRDLLVDSHRPGSQFWIAIQKVKSVFFLGRNTMFYSYYTVEGLVARGKPLYEGYPFLF
jgi:hypothetical protein